MFTADTVQPQDAVRTPGRSAALWGRGRLFPPWLVQAALVRCRWWGKV